MLGLYNVSGDSMAEDGLRISDWLEGGFPEPKSATMRQRQVINRRAHLLSKILSKEEQVSLRLMRYEFWLNNLSRLDASAIINKIRVLEEREKEESIARKVAKARRSKSVIVSADSCSVCGGKMDGDPVAPTCADCGKGSFHVAM